MPLMPRPVRLAYGRFRERLALQVYSYRAQLNRQLLGVSHRSQRE